MTRSTICHSYNAMYYNIYGHEKVCPVCGRKFLSSPEWAYKRMVRMNKTKDNARKWEKVKYYCSWGCLQKERKGGG